VEDGFAHPSEPRSFLGWFAVFAVVGLAVVAAINVYVDPINVTHSHRFVAEKVDVSQKGPLLVRFQHPDFIILGTSRVQRLDPRIAQRETGAKGFNAGIIQSSIKDAVNIATWVANRAAHFHEPMPHIIYGITPESFGRQPPGDYLGLPPLYQDAQTVVRDARTSRANQIRVKLRSLASLIQYQTLVHSLKILKYEHGNKPSPPAPIQPEPQPATTPAEKPPLRRDGYVTRGPYFPVLEANSTTFEQTVNTTFHQFYSTLKTQGGVAHVEESAAEQLVILFRLANHEGDTPTLVWLPMREDLAKELGPLGRDEYLRTTHAFLDSLHKRFNFRVFDYENLDDFGTAHSSFFDGVHPKADLANLEMERLVHDDPLIRHTSG